MKQLMLSVGLFIAAITSNAQDKPKGLNVNDKAPVFSAMDQSGKTVSLKGQLKSGAVVLIFYRGQWCPYCNKQLKGLEDSLSLITAKGATLVAVTPEKQENISKTIAKTKASYPILFDDGLKIMKSYDVAFTVDDKTVEKYKGYGIDFAEVNGTNGANLPVPAVYIINKEGVIIFKYFDADYRKRASVQDILDHL
ncbi:peroxiredoxin-like family protein [Ferruginibacter sp. SUN106]|uniref:peroxiredoxin-like family protein n=1 Tax=Ferruginibacter sp. SUN106 TaxID=2978348 RepID=UPI003D36A02B